MFTTPIKHISAAEFWEIMQRPENKDKHLELVDGMLLEEGVNSTMTGGMHGETAANILGFIWQFARQHKLGCVTAAETCYVLFQNPTGKDTIRCPDAAFVSFHRAPEPLPLEQVPFAPDLAIEVISPGNDADEMHSKVLDFIKYGTRLVWVFYPWSQTVVVHTASGSKTLNIEDTLQGGEVLPGFSVVVRDIFPE
ncbi:MAG: Uma2 family endonuclease [Anaerolineae bacterium]|nr:Uma2 family endonuclease [Anaerolineae bacterium]